MKKKIKELEKKFEEKFLELEERQKSFEKEINAKQKARQYGVYVSHKTRDNEGNRIYGIYYTDKQGNIKVYEVVVGIYEDLSVDFLGKDFLKITIGDKRSRGETYIFVDKETKKSFYKEQIEEWADIYKRFKRALNKE